MKNSYFWLFLALLPLYMLTCSQQVKNKSNVVSKEQLLKSLEKLADDSVLQAGILGFCLKKVASPHSPIVEFNAGKILNTASCQKTITTATALEILGEDFTFTTDIEYSGTLNNGILQGNIYLKGSGDPTLGSQIIPNLELNPILTTWAKKIQALGIKSIKGAIIADESSWEADVMPSHWIWSDMGNYYGAPVYALNVFDNSYKLYFRPAKLGQIATIIKTEPAIPQLQFINDVHTAAANTGDNASIAGAPYSNLRFTTGTVPAVGQSFVIKGAIPDPPLFLANQLTQKLTTMGIQVTQVASTSRILKLENKWLNSERKRIHRHTSPLLKTIVEYTNLYSVNLYAEAMLKQIGKKLEKKASTEKGIKAIKDFWAKRGISRAKFWMLDGSGLALQNGITASQLTDFLCNTKALKSFNTFYLSLPLSGVSGTMKGVGIGTKMQKNLRAKTGGMTGVSAYCGYFKNTNGELMAFSLIANRYTCKSALMQKKLTEILTKMTNL
jgi:serine-type D-Ala-D-Ala carboxypeptidase/endopeptidase (penicillin-binding protein 4)